MADTTIRRVLFRLEGENRDAEAAIDEIKVKAKELEEMHPELKVKINAASVAAQMRVLRGELFAGVEAAKQQQKAVEEAAAAEVRAAGEAAKAQEKASAAAQKAVEDYQNAVRRAQQQASSGGGFGGGFMNPATITAGIAAALAGLPAIAASGGALMGIALGAHLLIGTKKVQGPLYNQFHTMMDGLMSVIRVAALPLVKPLAEAFRQIGQFAKQMYPVLHSIFASLGPFVAPLVRGFEGLVRGVLPGFLHLMQAAQPAVQAVSGLLSTLGTNLGGLLNNLIPGVKSSAQFMTGLGNAISSMLPFVGTLASDLAQFLAPIMSQLGSNLMPRLADALDKIFNALSPLLPPIGQLVSIIANFTDTAMVNGLTSLGNIMVSLQGPIQTVANMLATLVGWAQTALNWLSRLPGLGFLKGTGGGGFGNPYGGIIGPALSGPELGGGGFSVPGGLGNWGSGVTDSQVASGAKGAGKKHGQKIIPQLAAGLVQALQGSQSQIGHATLSILRTIWGDEKAGVITRGEASELAKWVKADNRKLQALAVERNKIAKEIAAAKAYAANVAGNVESQFGIVNAGQGVNGAPASGGQIVATLQEEVRRTRSFAADIKKLAKMGLNKAYLRQLIEAGPVQGGPIADELANGPLSEIKQINAAEASLASAATGLGQLGADVVYDRGAIGKRFLVDLERQERQTERAMKKLAEALVGGTRHALKLELVGGAGAEADFVRFLKRWIRLHGGNPAVLGR